MLLGHKSRKRKTTTAREDASYGRDVTIKTKLKKELLHNRKVPRADSTAKVEVNSTIQGGEQKTSGGGNGTDKK